MSLLTQVIKISSSFKGIMDAKMYHGIAVQGVKQAKKIFDGECFYWQEDNDPKHSAKINRDYLSRKEKDGFYSFI